MGCKFCKGYSLCDVESPGTCVAFELKGAPGYVMLEVDVDESGEIKIDPDGVQVQVNLYPEEDGEFICRIGKFVIDKTGNFGGEPLNVYKADISVENELCFRRFVVSVQV